MNFSHALELLKSGKKLSVDGSDSFIYLVDGSKFTVNRAPLNAFYPEGTEIEYMPHIDICYPDGKCAVWYATNFALLSEGWEVVE